MSKNYIDNLKDLLTPKKSSPVDPTTITDSTTIGSAIQVGTPMTVSGDTYEPLQIGDGGLCVSDPIHTPTAWKPAVTKHYDGTITIITSDGETMSSIKTREEVKQRFKEERKIVKEKLKELDKMLEEAGELIYEAGDVAVHTKFGPIIIKGIMLNERHFDTTPHKIDGYVVTGNFEGEKVVKAKDVVPFNETSKDLY